MDNMQETDQSTTGLWYVGASIITGVLGWINLHTLNNVLQNLSLFVSICAGMMAIRHYYLQNKIKTK